MVFCNVDIEVLVSNTIKGHNPYFNRWFSAIKNVNTFEETDRLSQSLF